jgi:membrane protease YdiL (CAAX protease family)
MTIPFTPTKYQKFPTFNKNRMPTTRQAILYFPLTRIVIGLALTLGIGLVAMLAIQKLLSLTPLDQSDKDPIAGTVFAIVVCASYTLLFQRYEKRTVTELSSRNFPRYLTGGILLGLGLASAIVLIQYLTHVLSIDTIRSFLPLLPTLWNTFVNSVIAEVLIIGIVFRITEEWLGSWFALLILAVIFVILHITAPGATLISAIAVSTHAALLLGPAYIYTRSLWVPISIHFAWDFSFAGLYGASINSYTMDNSLLNTSTDGSDLLTGGYFGPQGSIQAAALCLLTGLVFLHRSRRNHKIIPPSFRKFR